MDPFSNGQKQSDYWMVCNSDFLTYLLGYMSRNGSNIRSQMFGDSDLSIYSWNRTTSVPKYFYLTIASIKSS